MRGTALLLDLLLGAVILGTPSAAPAQQETKEAAQAALEEYARYARNRNAEVRRAAVEELAAVDHHTVTAALLECLDDHEEMVREAAVAALGRQTNELGLADLIQRMWRGRDRGQRLAILRAFQRSVPKQAFSAVVDCLDDRDWEIRLRAAQLLGRYPDQDGKALGAVLPLVEDKEPLVRLAALEAILQLDNPRGHASAVAALSDSDWRVKAAAIKVCRRYRMKSSIQPLIDVLKSEEGRLQDDATDALQDICDRDLPGDGQRWQEWWDRVKDGFHVPTAAEIAERRRNEKTRRAGYDPPRPNDYPPYHGIKTRSRRMLFVIDTSASMADVVTLDRSDERRMKEFRERYGDLECKIDIAREELIKMVAGLKPWARFNIITFDSKVDPWEKRLVPATGGNKNKAIKFLARLTPQKVAPTGGGFKKAASIGGQTNTFEALNACFGLFKGDEVDDKDYRTEADTVFFLSDGTPSTGRITQPQTLLDYFAAVNKRAGLVIHTISLGNANKVLMETLAQQSGGQYVMIGN